MRRAGDRVGERRGARRAGTGAPGRAARPCRTRGRRPPDGRSPAGGRGSGACGRLEPHAQERRARQRLASTSKCVTAVARRVGVGRHPRAHAPVAADRRVDRARSAPAGGPRRAPGTRARSRAPAARACRRAVRLGSLLATTSRPDVSRSRRCTIPRAGLASPPARAPASACDERAGRVPARGMHDDARRLVDDEQVVVLVARPRRARRCGRPAGAALGLVDRRSVSPPRSRWRLGRGAPSTSTSAVVDQALRPGARAERRRRGTRRGARRRRRVTSAHACILATS